MLITAFFESGCKVTDIQRKNLLYTQKKLLFTFI